MCVLTLFISINCVSAIEDNSTSSIEKIELYDEMSVGNEDNTLSSSVNVWYVNGSKSDDGDGSIYAPFNNIKSSIDNSHDGDTIYIASGTYGGIKNINLTIDKELNLINWDDGKVIFDGQNKTRIFTISASSFNITGLTFINGLNYDNCGGGLFFSHKLINSVINANFINNNAYYGGAIYFNEGVDGVTFKGSYENNSAVANGGVFYFSSYCNNSHWLISCIKNKASGFGGVFNFNASSSNNTFNGNYSRNSGGRYGGIINFADTSDYDTFNGNYSFNVADLWGGVLYFAAPVNHAVVSGNFLDNSIPQGSGAAIAAENGIFNSIFSGNFSNNYVHDFVGGAIEAYGSFYNNTVIGYFANNSQAALSLDKVVNSMINGTFIGNFARYCGAISIEDSINSTFSGTYINNTCTLKDGGVFTFGANLINTLINGTFINNTAIRNGGAISIFKKYDDVIYIIQNVTISGLFINNTVSGNGGAIYIDSDSALLLNNCIFENNQARNGGAVYINASQTNIISCKFDNNVARDGAAAYFVKNGTVKDSKFTNNFAKHWGAGVLFEDVCQVINSNFTDNCANFYGAGVYCVSEGTVTGSNFINNLGNLGGGAIYFDKNGNVSRSIFNNNYAYEGGAISAQSDVSIDNSQFMNNNASTGGGALYVNGKGTVYACDFVNNSAYISGGAIHTQSEVDVNGSDFKNNSAFYGSAIYFNNASTIKSISNSSFLNNRANANALEVTKNDYNITITFTGNDNLLNAIYSKDDAEVNITNVTYWGVNEIANTGSSTTTPPRSNRETGQNITVIIIVNDIIVLNDVKVTDFDGKIVLNITAGENYYILVRHDTDSYYTETEKTISNMTFDVNVTSQTTDNKSVNLTAKSNIYGEVMSGKFIFVLPNGVEINANYANNGTWWVVHTFNHCGEYNVGASYVGLDNVIVKNGTVTIIKEDSIITLDDIILNYGESKNITVTTDGASGITAKIDETDVDVVNNFTIPISSLDIGNYTLTVTTIPDEDHFSVNKTVKITVIKAPTEIKLINETLDLKVGDISDCVANLIPADAGNLTFNSNNENVVKVTAEGLIIAVEKGNTTVNISFAGNDKYNAAKNVTLIVTVRETKQNASMDVDSGKAVEDENSTITVNLPKDATGNVTAVVDGKTYTAPVVNGTATISVPGLKSGNYTVPVTYSGDNKYYPASKEITYEVEEVDKSDIISAPDVTKYFAGFERFVVNITDYKGNPLSNKSLTISINGVSYDRLTKDDGTASIALGLNSGVYNATVTVGNETINSVVTILPTVNGTDVVKVYRNATQYYATFRDSEGNYLKEGTAVRFNINGVFYDRKVSGSEGLAKLNLNLEQGTYVLTAMNPVTSEMGSNNITIVSRLVENKDITKYYRNATQYTVKVLGDDGNPVGAGENVTFNINGVFYTRTTNASGIAKLNLNLQPGDYIITAEYKNCRVSNKIKVLPVLSAHDISMKYRDGTEFVATLVDGQGNPFAGENVTFNINGVFYNRITDASGQAKLNINLMPGEYIITSSYNEYGIGNKITITG